MQQRHVSQDERGNPGPWCAAGAADTRGTSTMRGGTDGMGRTPPVGQLRARRTCLAVTSSVPLEGRRTMRCGLTDEDTTATPSTPLGRRTRVSGQRAAAKSTQPVVIEHPHARRVPAGGRRQRSWLPRLGPAGVRADSFQACAATRGSDAAHTVRRRFLVLMAGESAIRNDAATSGRLAARRCGVRQTVRESAASWLRARRVRRAHLEARRPHSEESDPRCQGVAVSARANIPIHRCSVKPPYPSVRGDTADGFTAALNLGLRIKSSPRPARVSSGTVPPGARQVSRAASGPCYSGPCYIER